MHFSAFQFVSPFQSLQKFCLVLSGEFFVFLWNQSIARSVFMAKLQVAQNGNMFQAWLPSAPLGPPFACEIMWLACRAPTWGQLVWPAVIACVICATCQASKARMPAH